MTWAHHGADWDFVQKRMVQHPKLYADITDHNRAAWMAVLCIERASYLAQFEDGVLSDDGFEELENFMATVTADAAVAKTSDLSDMYDRRFKQLLNKRYSHKHWPRQSRDHGGLAKGIYDHFYRGDLGFNPQKAYDSINADTGVICGNIEIAKAAATAFRSPVYLVIIETAPSHAQDGDGDKKYGMRYAGHTWDLKAGTEDWDDYIPQSSDLRFSAILQRMWYTLARDERLPDEFFPMNHHGRRANLNVLGRRGVVGPRHWRDGVCAWWSHNGVGKEFWWQN